MTKLMAFVRRRARAPAALALTDQLVVSGCNFGSAVIVARELPTHDFGLFSLAAMCCLFLSNLHRAALTQPMNVLGASDTPDQIGRRLAGLLRLHGLIVPLAAAALLLAAWLLFPDAGIVLAAIVYFTCFALQETLRRYWYTRVAIREALVNDVLSYGGQLAALLVLAGVDGLSGASALSAMAATSLLAFAIGAAQVGAVAFRPA
ncbi:MAG: hypothetical protein OEU93_17300, partial [Rubrivivax sp.]|nr:hypothetical protein [Rubrivivax sp.]